MLAKEFISVIESSKIFDYVGVDDFADRLSFMYSVGIITLASFVITIKQYLIDGISCFMSPTPSGTKIDNFLKNFCWVHGTIPLLDGERIPEDEQEWLDRDKYRIAYYQWVPFVLAIQALLFFLPHLSWRFTSRLNAGSDLKKLLSHISKLVDHDSEEKIDLIAIKIINIFNLLRAKQKKVKDYSAMNAYNYDALFKTNISHGQLFFFYILTKFSYLANSIAQLALMYYFLGLHKEGVRGVEGTNFEDNTGGLFGFGVLLANSLVKGEFWQTTRVFPRVTFCVIPKQYFLGTKNTYTAQCVLPINMLNEKIYLFLWFWIILVAICTILSLLVWLARIYLPGRRKAYIKLLLKRGYALSKEVVEDKDVDEFFQAFLDKNVIFLFYMISVNVGEDVAMLVVKAIFVFYQDNLKEKENLELTNEQDSKLSKV